MEFQLPNENLIQVKDLISLGINSRAIVELYQEEKGIKLNWNELIKVSPNEEGKNIKFETLDQISIVVHVSGASGVGNKEGIGQK